MPYKWRATKTFFFTMMIARQVQLLTEALFAKQYMALAIFGTFFCVIMYFIVAMKNKTARLKDSAPLHNMGFWQHKDRSY